MLAARRSRPAADHPHQRPFSDTPAPHRHEPLLRQSCAAAQPARQLHRHELVPVRAPSLPARRVRGDRLPAAHRPAQELRRYPHGHGCPRLLTHDTYFDEFIILSGDADFTPVLHRLRAHARRTVIFRQRLHGGALHGDQRRRDPREPISSRCCIEARFWTGGVSRRRSDAERPHSPSSKASRPRARTSWPRSSRSCAPPTVTACRSRRWPTARVRALGHEKTIGTGWGGAGSFRELLRQRPARGHPPDGRSRLTSSTTPRARAGAKTRRVDWRAPEARTPRTLTSARPYVQKPPPPRCSARLLRCCVPRNPLSVPSLRHPGPPPRRSAVRWPRRSPKPSRASRGYLAPAAGSAAARRQRSRDPAVDRAHPRG